MNKAERALADSMAANLLDGIEKLTAAIKYHADVLGYYTDKINPVDEAGHQKVKLELVTPVPSENDNFVTTTITFEDLRAAVNRYAGHKGKDDTLAIIKKFAVSGALKDVAETDYENLLIAVM